MGTNASHEMVLWDYGSGFSLEDKQREFVDDPTSSTGSIVHAPAHRCLNWDFTKRSEDREGDMFEVCAVIRVDKKPSSDPHQDAFLGTVWNHAGAVMTNPETKSVNLGMATDSKWHVWRLGAVPGGIANAMVFVDHADRFDGVYIDRFFLAPVELTGAEKAYLKEFDSTDKAALCVESFNEPASVEMTLAATKEISIVTLVMPAEGSGEVRITLEYTDEHNAPVRDALAVERGVHTINLPVRDGMTLNNVRVELDGSGRMNRFYAMIPSPAPHEIACNSIIAKGYTHLFQNGKCEELVQLGNYLRARSMLPQHKEQKAWALRTGPSLRKLLASDLPQEWTKRAVTDNISITMAKNESETFNAYIIPLANEDVNDVKLKVEATKPPGETALNVLMERIEYVYCRKIHNATPGWWPDPLIPFAPGGKQRFRWDRLGAVMLTVKTSPDTPSGDYEMEVTVTGAVNNQTEIVPIKVHVYDFALPKRPALRSVFFFTTDQDDRREPGTLATAYGLKKLPWEYTKKHLLKAASYRITCAPKAWVCAIREPDGSFSFDFSEKDRIVDFVMNECNGTAFPLVRDCCGLEMWMAIPTINRETGEKRICRPKYMTNEYFALMKAYLVAAMKHYKAKGIFEYHYIGLSDEAPARFPLPTAGHVSRFTKSSVILSMRSRRN